MSISDVVHFHHCVIGLIQYNTFTLFLQQKKNGSVKIKLLL